jgi:predicted TPR repeat methyltransferase
MLMSEQKRAEVLERVYGAKSQEDLEKAYDDWAEHYDEDLFKFGYLFPSVAAGYFGRYVKSGAKIVDAGAGTGLMGRILAAMDYPDITAFDLSQGMLDVAEKTGAYKQLDRQVLGEPLKYETDEFDACICIGTFTEGHAPTSGYDEIARIVKPGGYFIVTIREDVYLNSGFKDKEEEMAKARTMKLIDKSQKFRTFSSAEPGIVGHVYVYQFTK